MKRARNNNEILVEKYRPFLKRRGGIFRSKKRKRLLNISPGRPGWDENEYDFRYRVRTDVKQALIDFELFIETAEKKDLNNTINTETIGPIFDTYFQIGRGELTEKDTTRADLARLLISYAFEYLSWPYLEYKSIPDYEKKIIDKATRLATDLTIRMKHSVNELAKEDSS
jgi:hypothetical protein